MPKLVLLSKGKARTIEMGQELTIGRGYSNLLRLEGEEISRVHAIIYRRNRDYIIRDLDSKNGVYVNGSRAAFAELSSGDLIQVGKYRIVFDPPSDFNLQDLVESGFSQTASGPGPLAGFSDSDFAHSRRFSTVPPPDQRAIAEADPEPEVCREEVVIYHRAELVSRLSDPASTASGKAGDYQDEFFNHLLQDGGHIENRGFSSIVLQSLVKALGGHRGVVILRDPDSNDLLPGAVYPEEDDVAVNRIVLRSGFSEGKAMLCPSAADCGLFRDSATVTRDRICSLVSVPLCTPEIVGLLYVDRQGDASEGFSIAHLLAAGRVGRLLELHLTEVAALGKENKLNGR